MEGFQPSLVDKSMKLDRQQLYKEHLVHKATADKDLLVGLVE